MAVADQKIYLASKSPRRRELLRQIGIEFEILMLRDGDVRDGAVSEIVLPGEAPEDYVARVALSDHEHQPSGSMGRFHGPASGQYV